MRNALPIESATPVSGAGHATPDSARSSGLSGSTAGGRGRITATSFRQLTARLRREPLLAEAEPVAAAPTVQALVQARAEVLAGPDAIESIASPLPQEMVTPDNVLPDSDHDDGKPDDSTADQLPEAAPSMEGAFDVPDVMTIPALRPLTPFEPELLPVEAAEPAASEAAVQCEAEPPVHAPEPAPAVPVPEASLPVFEPLTFHPPEAGTELVLGHDEATAPVQPLPDQDRPDVAAVEQPIAGPDGVPGANAAESGLDAESPFYQNADPSDVMPEPHGQVESAAIMQSAAVVHQELEAASDGAPQDAVEASNPLPDRVVDALLKTIARAVYAKPSASDRAAFLRDIAALVESGELAMPEMGVAATDLPALALPAAVQRTAQLVQSEPDNQIMRSGVEETETIPAPEAMAPPLHEPELPVRPGSDDEDVRAGMQPAEAPQAARPMAARPSADTPALATVLASRIGAASPLLRSQEDTTDPFAREPQAADRRAIAPVDATRATEEGGELALSLLDMMSGGSASSLPHERALAADTLLRIVPRIPVKQLLAVAERLSIMEQPPPLLVAKLIRDPRPEIVAPLLERCMHISDQDLMTAAVPGDIGKQRMIARRRILSPVLADHLIALGDPSVVLTMIRNPGVTFAHDAFHVLAEIASQHHGLLAPLTTRADLPPPVAFELFWFVPPELRRYIFSRFLTDSENLNRILRITLATQEDSNGDAQPADTKFPAREAIEVALNHAQAFRLEESAQAFAGCGGISKETALRILADRDGEPLTVILKSMGYPRSRFAEAVESLQRSESAIIRPDRPADELQTIFDSLSFNKARILLTYWDWHVCKAGPYAPRH